MTEPLFTADFVKLTIADLAYFLCFGIGVFTLPLFVVGPIGGDSAGAGLAVGVFSVTALVLRPIAGALADAVGRRPLMLSGAMLAGLATGSLAFAEDLWLVVVLRIIAGIAEAAFFVAGFAALADLAPANRLAEALSYNSLALYLGIGLGPVLGETLVRSVGFGGAWIGAGVLALAAVFAIGMLPETAQRTGRLDFSWGHLFSRPALGPSFALFCGIFGSGSFLAFAVIRAGEVRLENPSIVLLVFGAVVVICRIALANLGDRVDAMRLGALGLSLVCIGLATIATSATAVALVAGAAVIGVGVSLITPAFFAAAFSRVSPDERGAASGTASIFIDFGLGGGPILAGLIATEASLSAAFVAGAVLAAFGTVYALTSARPRTHC